MTLLGAFGAPLDAHLADQLSKMGTDAAPYVPVCPDRTHGRLICLGIACITCTPARHTHI